LLAFTTFHLQMPDNHNYFAPLAEFLKERGYRALYPQVFPLGSVAKRAAQLREQISAWTSEPVNIIAHSMGGLDARYMITHLGMVDRVRSLTTIAAPHRGTVLADWFMTNFQKRVPLVRALEALGATVAGFADCCPAACAEFNKKTPDSPRVTYFSYGGEVSFARVSPMLRRAWNMLTAMEGANDGMISVASSRWGEYLGTIHVDHFTQTPDLMFVRPGEDFDVLGFYCHLLEDLARRGF
jgi:triacylglycerol lipase